MSKKMKWCTLAIAACFSVTTLLSSHTGFADSGSATEQPEWTKWLQSHANPVEKLAPEDGDTYEDLQFLKKTLKGKRVVLLGESSHGAAEFNSAKARLIQYLHEELDYDVLAFESGLAETTAANLHAADQTPLKTMQDSIYGVWHAKETLPLFEYLKKEQKSNDPLILTGFDIQPSNGSFRNFLKDWFQKVNPLMGEKAYQLESKFLQIYTSETDADRFRLEKGSLIGGYKDLLKFVRENKKELSAVYPRDRKLLAVTEYALQDRIHMIDRILEKYILFSKYTQEQNYQEAQKYLDEGSVLRDQAMAKNLTWLAEKLYPNKKIIVWAHNIHIRKANTRTENPYRTSLVTMGQLLPQQLQKDSYVVGLYMNRGVSALNNRQPAPVRYPHPEGNLESILSKSGNPNIFVDLLHTKNKKATSWMFTGRQVLDWGLWDERIVPREQYDGILFIDEVHLPQYVEYPTSAAQMRDHVVLPNELLPSSPLMKLK
ncbi:erythromycin esterase family protein [Lihuaxuella thermophila]|uniref:Erythromycin esterase n=1 Tax=Lihuaxuella thermophila TaxID=1173111 RepID=A0A1H8BF19_9BACL|nr:erythromycin esterase family protein [Lihuaxuella thermophila]SEM80457.1 erythromycin esterase [Lihuaxuella thermophila]